MPSSAHWRLMAQRAVPRRPGSAAAPAAAQPSWQPSPTASGAKAGAVPSRQRATPIFACIAPRAFLVLRGRAVRRGRTARPTHSTACRFHVAHRLFGWTRARPGRLHVRSRRTPRSATQHLKAAARTRRRRVVTQCLPKAIHLSRAEKPRPPRPERRVPVAAHAAGGLSSWCAVLQCSRPRHHDAVCAISFPPRCSAVQHQSSGDLDRRTSTDFFLRVAPVARPPPPRGADVQQAGRWWPKRFSVESISSARSRAVLVAAHPGCRALGGPLPVYPWPPRVARAARAGFAL